MQRIAESELILNTDGSIFHLHLFPEDIADTIILVGDQSRVEVVSGYFDKVELKRQNREFITHTGYFNSKRITVVSTGIGTDNIDIVVNELDALANINLKTRTINKEIRKLNFIRIGTSGALQGDIDVDTPVISQMAIGFDGLLNFYKGRNNISDLEMEKAFRQHTEWSELLTSPYFIESSETLLEKIGYDMRKGITISAPGFYGPQGRELRLPVHDSKLNDKITSFNYNDKKITNYEMECSAIYGLSKLMGHNAVTVCNIIANRISKKYSINYRETVKKLVLTVLERV